ncbi:response regulator [Patescibacteria group bacterium]|nr:response regulator [Patescibacteria group bacterium]
MSKILIVEDEKDIRDIYKKELQYSGFEVIEAPTGEMGLDLFSKENPDLTLLDITLQDSSGIDILKKMKEKDSTKKIVMITNLDTPVVINEAYDNGADGYIIKMETSLSQLVDEVKRYTQ